MLTKCADNNFIRKTRLKRRLKNYDTYQHAYKSLDFARDKLYEKTILCL